MNNIAENNGICIYKNIDIDDFINVIKDIINRWRGKRISTIDAMEDIEISLKELSINVTSCNYYGKNNKANGCNKYSCPLLRRRINDNYNK